MFAEVGVEGASRATNRREPEDTIRVGASKPGRTGEDRNIAHATYFVTINDRKKRKLKAKKVLALFVYRDCD